MPESFPRLPAGWVSDWETFRSADGKVQLFSVIHHREPWSGPRALFIIHGMGEHGGRYLHVPHYVKDVVDAVAITDLRGHGRSEGLRGHVEKFDDLVDDMALALRHLDSELQKRFGRSEIHVLGHSLGGHIALRMMFLHPNLPVASLTVSAPFLAVKQKVPVAKRVGASVLSKVWGSLQLSTGIDCSGLSHDPDVIEAYKRDRLVHDKMTPQFYSAMSRAWADTLKRSTGILPPVQFLVPMADPIVDPDVSVAFYRQLKHREKRLKQYKNFFHESLNEPERQQAFDDLVSWIKMHSSGTAGSGGGE